MKAIFVQSSNGYIARCPFDDMSWTPSQDKKLFHLLTTFDSGVCVCSKHTYDLLPKKMLADPARKYIVAERTGKNSLVALNQVYPSAVLIGGAKFLKAAHGYSIIDTFVVSTTKVPIVGNENYKNPFAEILTNPVAQIDFGDVIVRVYKQQHGKEK